MKIRITDLLDNYYDDSVKLSPPEEIFREKEGLTTPVTRPKTSLAQKIMMTAAALILVVTGAFAVVLTLPIQRGASLGKGAPSAPLETFGIEPPESAITSSSTEESMVSAEEAVEPAEIQLEDNAATEISYLQKGTHLQFTMLFDDPAAESSIQEDSLILDLIPHAEQTDEGSERLPLDNVSLESASYQDGQYLVYGSADMGDAQTGLRFCVTLYQDEIAMNAGLFGWGASTVPYSPDYAYAEGYTEGFLYYQATEFGGTAVLKELAVTKEKQLIITFGKEDAPEATSEELELLGEALLEQLQRTDRRGMDIYTAQEYTGTDSDWTALGLDFSTIPYSLKPASVSGLEQLIFDLSAYDFDPSQVANIETHVRAMEAETADAPETLSETSGESLSAALDTDGDGLLTAEVGLPVELDREVGTLVSLSIDLEAEEYIWHKDVPGLELILEGDFSWDYDKALDDIGYNQLETSWTNAFLETWQSKAILVFTDGSGLCLYNGDVIRYEAGDFQDVTQTDFQERIISHLEIDGMYYEFH